MANIRANQHMEKTKRQIICLNPQYSTTRMVTRHQLVIKNPEDSKIRRILFLPDKSNRIDCGGLRTNGCFKTSFEDKPLITVITIVYNNAANLKKTIKSVLAQNYDNIEYIIIDGGSDDGTLDIIKKYDKQIDYWVSEPDSGISNAFNKGLSCQTGQWINFLNASDFFLDENFISNNIQSFQNPNLTIITAFCKFGPNTVPDEVKTNEQPRYVKAMISHQGSFVRNTVFEKIGGFNENFKIRMDYEFWLRALHNHDFFFINKVIVDYALSGSSSQDMIGFYKEEIKANKMHLENFKRINRTVMSNCIITLINNNVILKRIFQILMRIFNLPRRIFNVMKTFPIIGPLLVNIWRTVKKIRKFSRHS